VLITDFVCFGMLPWIQTRPPRALEAAQPWSSGIRSFNVSLLGRLSIGVNTVPSGHAAEALAAALLLSSAPASVSVWVWAAAAAISAGAVFGRYHYAVDAFAGWIVALIVWSSI
jgi:membrane-associated phospholipid phosphatase